MSGFASVSLHWSIFSNLKFLFFVTLPVSLMGSLSVAFLKSSRTLLVPTNRVRQKMGPNSILESQKLWICLEDPYPKQHQSFSSMNRGWIVKLVCFLTNGKEENTIWSVMSDLVWEFRFYFGCWNVSISWEVQVQSNPLNFRWSQLPSGSRVKGISPNKIF